MPAGAKVLSKRGSDSGFFKPALHDFLLMGKESAPRMSGVLLLTFGGFLFV